MDRSRDTDSSVAPDVRALDAAVLGPSEDGRRRHPLDDTAVLLQRGRDALGLSGLGVIEVGRAGEEPTRWRHELGPDAAPAQEDWGWAREAATARLGNDEDGTIGPDPVVLMDGRAALLALPSPRPPGHGLEQGLVALASPDAPLPLAGLRQLRGYLIGALEREARGAQALGREQDVRRLAAIGATATASAHAINNALGSVLALVPLIESPAVGDRERRGHLADLREEAQRAADRVRNLLELGRTGEPQPTALSMEVLVREAVAMARPSLEEAGVEVALGPAAGSGSPAAQGISHHVRQALYECIENAIEAYGTPPPDDAPQRIVRIEWGEADTEVVVRVRDRAGGLGALRPVEAEQPFTTTREDAIGLGLPLARHLVARSGGTLTLDAAGDGTVVTIRLPRVDRAAQSPAVGGEEASPGITYRAMERLGRMRLLVVDDEPVLRTAMTRMLELYSPELIAEAANAAEALSALRRPEARFDAILLDMRLPDRTGRAVFETLRREDPDAAGRVIFVLGERVEGPLMEFLRAHELPYVSKPFEAEALLRAIVQRARTAPS